MADQRVIRMAQVLVDYSTNIQPGDKVVIEATTVAEELVRCVYRRVLERGGYPHILLALPDQEEILFAAGKDDQLEFVPEFHKLAAETFDARIRIYSETNTRALTQVDPARARKRQKGIAGFQNTVLKRGADGSLRWISTQFPTPAYAMEAEMGWQAYQDFAFRACHVDENTPDPVAFWRNIQAQQQRYVHRIQGHDRVTLRGPNVDLSLSIKDRIFLNSCGLHNLPDGEIYTGPVEDSVNGWVKFTYPAVFGGRVVEGVQLTFKDGKVVDARADRNAEYLLQMLESDAGARYLGEFAIGTNFEIDHFTRNILFDEKIGGSFHLALGASYPETGGRNHSVIHWDMICDLKHESEMTADGEVIYRNGEFIF